MSRPEAPRCPRCGAAPAWALVWIHGHAQCPHCGFVAAPCCEGETARPAKTKEDEPMSNCAERLDGTLDHALRDFIADINAEPAAFGLPAGHQFAVARAGKLRGAWTLRLRGPGDGPELCAQAAADLCGACCAQAATLGADRLAQQLCAPLAELCAAAGLALDGKAAKVALRARARKAIKEAREVLRGEDKAEA